MFRQLHLTQLRVAARELDEARIEWWQAQAVRRVTGTEYPAAQVRAAYGLRDRWRGRVNHYRTGRWRRLEKVPSAPSLEEAQKRYVSACGRLLAAATDRAEAATAAVAGGVTVEEIAECLGVSRRMVACLQPGGLSAGRRWPPGGWRVNRSDLKVGENEFNRKT